MLQSRIDRLESPIFNRSIRKMIFSRKALENVIFALLVAGALLVIFTPNNIFFKRGATFAVQIMFFYLAVSFIFLIARRQRLMLTSLACCAALNVFLKGSIDSAATVLTTPGSEKVKLAHFNVANSSPEDLENTIESILSTDADLISLQEITPEWDFVLHQALSTKYPHNFRQVRIDFHGISVYSRHEFVTIDTFLFGDIPNVLGCIKIDSTEQMVHFVSSHTEPPINTASFKKLKGHFDCIADRLKKLNGPVVAMGDYNAVSWLSEVKYFREKVGLVDSRDFLSASPSSSLSLMSMPIDHIFFSEHMECVNFESVWNNNSERLGIVGNYQFKHPEIEL